MPADRPERASSAIEGGVGEARPHESAELHVSGEAIYTDDIPLPAGTLHAAIGLSERAHARLLKLDLDAVQGAPGVVTVLTATDIPGENNHGPVVHDDPIFATGEVEYAGQSLFAVLADSANAARRAARLARVECQDLDPVLDARTALARESFVLPTRRLARGDAAAAIASAPRCLQGSLSVGGQEHFYLEGQVAAALPGEDCTMQVWCSTQHPSEVQRLVAHCLGWSSKDVVVQCRRMGGGFGGKETQPALLACIAALGAKKTGRPVKLRLDRDADFLVTGKRHPFALDYDVGFDDDGLIRGARLVLASNCGRSVDLSDAVNGRALFHADNCYFLPDVAIVSHRCKTHQPSHTAFRGFGGPQGMMLIECVVDDIARTLGRDPLEIRRRNFYGTDSRNVTPYGMTVEDNVIGRIVDELAARADYAGRRQTVAEFNASGGLLRRGIALTPVKFGISFTSTHLNQAGALLHVYTDGSILLNHGGTEMGQGLHTKVAQVVAEELQVDLRRIRCTATDTSKVPNTSATAASASSDLNGKAAQAAAQTIRRRLAEFAAAKYGVPAEAVLFRAGRVRAGEAADLAFEELVMQAYHARVPLSATGFYATPKIGYDPQTLTGRPFFYFCYGAAVSEVVVDTLTGESKLLRVDILHDVGCSLNPAIDLGQVEGGFLQGVGWLTSEELVWDERGRLLTHAPSTYKIPAVSDWPAVFNVELAPWSRNREDTIYRSKAVGEPPLMLAMSVFHAIRDAIAAAAGGGVPRLDAPATPERILAAIEELRGRNDPGRAA
ncbi:MAG TPA: xanthine dehydrogenase molybdopterin binding subunit [Steroidobacteraceae bacterium]|nr:xanthine dehydrogenase molybdopterin binding subunit [Steroidobacteraceae bacterium]